ICWRSECGRIDIQNVRTSPACLARQVNGGGTWCLHRAEWGRVRMGWTEDSKLSVAHGAVRTPRPTLSRRQEPFFYLISLPVAFLINVRHSSSPTSFGIA